MVQYKGREYESWKACCDDWEYERLGIKENAVNAYVYNYASPNSSEFGAVGLALTRIEGIVRIY